MEIKIEREELHAEAKGKQMIDVFQCFCKMKARNETAVCQLLVMYKFESSGQ